MSDLSNEEISRYASYELDLLNIVALLHQEPIDSSIPDVDTLNEDRRSDLSAAVADIYKKRFEDADEKESVQFTMWLLFKCAGFWSELIPPSKSVLQEALSQSFEYANYLENPELFYK